MSGNRTLRRMPRGTPKEPLTDYGQRLRDAREAAGLTQAELAKAADLTQATIGELERKGQGSRHTAKLAAACKVRVEWLARGEMPMASRSLSKEVAAAAEKIEALPAPERDRVLRLVRQLLELAEESVSKNSAVQQKDRSTSENTDLHQRRSKAA